MKNISVIIPAFNAQETIIATLNSLMSQSDKNFEIVIVDDGSSDKSLYVAKNVLEKHQFQNYQLIKQNNKGVSDARNNGILNSTNDYVFFLDSDDFVHCKMIEILKRKIIKYDSEVIAWGYNKVKPNQEVLSRYQEDFDFRFRNIPGKEALKEIIKDRTLSVWTGSAIYKKKFLETNQLMFTSSCYAGEDLEFIYKSLAKSSKFIFIENILSFYVKTPGSITMSYNIRMFDSVLAMERVAKYLENNKKLDNYNLSNNLYNNEMISHYVYSFTDSYNNINMCKSFLNIKKIRFLKNEINNNYPGLMKKMKYKLIMNKDENVKTFIMNKLIAISPLIFFNILELKDRSFN